MEARMHPRSATALLERHARRNPHHAHGRKVEIVWRAFHALNRGFAGGDERYPELLDPEIEWVPMMSLTDGPTYRAPEDAAWLMDARGGRITRLEAFVDRGEALVAAGLAA